MPKIEEVLKSLNDLHSKLTNFPESQKKFDEVTDWVKKQKDENGDSYKGKADKKMFEEIDNVLKTTKNCFEKFQSKNPLKITAGVLDVVSSLTHLVVVDKPYGLVIRSLFAGVSWLLTESTPNEPNVVVQVAEVVHDEMVRFNRRLQDQKFNGLKRRVSDQIYQFRHMKPGEKLDDFNLWNDYVHFLGELANRLEAPVPFKDSLTEDPDVADFVTAVVTYAEAHTCFMALLFVAKAVYADFGITHDNDVTAVERKMDCQVNDAKGKLSFLSEERFLTFLGKIDGGKLTKIVALSRRFRGRSVVETVRRNLGLSPMHHLETVEEAAREVGKMSVKLKSARICDSFWRQLAGIRISIQFINDADFPIKIVSGEIGWSQGDPLKFEQIVQPGGRHYIDLPFFTTRWFSTGGYLNLDIDNVLDSADVGPLEYTRVIEFAMSNYVFSNISIQDKTDARFSHGQATLNEKSYADTLYFSEGGKYYIAKAEIFVCWPDRIWRFVFQDFDPEAVGGMGFNHLVTAISQRQKWPMCPP